MSTLFLALDFMVGVGDQLYTLDATGSALGAIEEARRRGLTVIYTKVGFLPGHPEVAAGNRVFGGLRGTDRLVGSTSALVDMVRPLPGEPVLDKKRFSAFAGSGLWTILRAQRPSTVVLCGLSTSGVVLSTSLELIDADFDVTILSDCCADPKPQVHSAILEDILPSRARVCTGAEWIAEAPRPGAGSQRRRGQHPF